MSKKVIRLIITLIVIVIIVAGCGKDKDKKEKEMVTIKDALGTEKITKNPKRIVVLEYSFADYLASLNVKPVGIADDGNAKNITKTVRDKIGKYESVGSRPQPNMEVISKLKPDLIIADVSRHKKIKAELNKIAPTIMLVSGTGDYNANIDSFKTVAKAIGKEKEGGKRLEKHEKILAAVRKKIEHSSLKSAFAFGISNTGMFINNEDTFMGQFLIKMGIKPEVTKDKTAHIGERKGGPYIFLNNEELANINPKVMILATDGNTDKNRTKFIDPAVWKSLKAVKNHKVYDVDRSKWLKSRGIIASESMAEDLEKIVDKIENNKT
ncbi:ABC transporter substrate-binding protein [Staphylococcus schweitzeri]|uniref:ABC transporter substrate-binding protein n=1 Tax=Staphylococcus schweitzeri TaxID=1654388 RepID=UPI000506950B|nr:Fe(3+) dicitrate ABC transporter substrate-binding protein [Staphylococcus schweitzeri]CDR23813.1 transport system extracellular binding lipoprotein [Staphylococcus schweitzeri]